MFDMEFCRGRTFSSRLKTPKRLKIDFIRLNPQHTLKSSWTTFNRHENSKIISMVGSKSKLFVQRKSLIREKNTNVFDLIGLFDDELNSNSLFFGWELTDNFNTFEFILSIIRVRQSFRWSHKGRMYPLSNESDIFLV